MKNINDYDDNVLKSCLDEIESERPCPSEIAIQAHREVETPGKPCTDPKIIEELFGADKTENGIKALIPPDQKIIDSAKRNRLKPKPITDPKILEQLFGSD